MHRSAMPRPVNGSPLRPRRVSTAVCAAIAASALVAGCAEDATDATDDAAGNGDTDAAEEATSPGTDGEDAEAGNGEEPFATANMVDAQGTELGTVEFFEVDGGTRIDTTLSGMPPGGFHGYHVHEVGECEPDSMAPDGEGEPGAFLSAGGHVEGTDDHADHADHEMPEGEAPEDGAHDHPHHGGDMPPLFVTGDGTVSASTVTDRLDADVLLAEGGTAVIIHEDPDNFANIPERYAPEGPDEDTLSTGDAGDRFACGVVAES